MILGTKARYAVTAMVDLAVRGQEATPLSQLAEANDIPLPYLEQIFTRLRKAGIVDSVRGPGGGYRLARPARDISVLCIVQAADEALKMTRCEGTNAPSCGNARAKCSTHHLWEGLERQIYKYMQDISLEIVCGTRSRPPSFCADHDA